MISIIIPTVKWCKKYLDLCVNSIKQNTQNFDYEILIGENGPGTDEPQGQCQAVNKMAKKAKGDWLLVSNNDMYYPKGWDKKLKFIADCFSPNLIEPVGNAGSAPPFLKLDAGFTLKEFNRDKVDEFVKNHQENPSILENGFNLPLFIKKDLFEKIEGYDENYDPWGSNSDSDLEYKIVLAGVQPKRDRNILVYHFSNKSGTFDPENNNYWQKNMSYFKEKWGFERISSPEIWQAELNIPYDKLKYKPDWMEK